MSTLSGGPNIISNGLVLYLDASNSKSYISGSTIWTDISKESINGTLTNGPTFSSNNRGIITFDGSNDLYECLTTSKINTIVTNNSLTLSVFFRNDFTASFRDIAGLNKVSGNNPFVIRQSPSNNDLIIFDITVSGSRYTPTIKTSQPNNTWTYVCGTFGNNQIKTYYNGALVTTVNTTGNIRDFDSNQFRIGGLGYTYYKGDISNVSLYNRALTDQEVLQNYNATKTRFIL